MSEVAAFQLWHFMAWIIVLIIMLGLASALTGIGLNPIRPLKLNKGKSTKYMFFINPQT